MYIGRIFDDGHQNSFQATIVKNMSELLILSSSYFIVHKERVYTVIESLQALILLDLVNKKRPCLEQAHEAHR